MRKLTQIIATGAAALAICGVSSAAAAFNNNAPAPNAFADSGIFTTSAGRIQLAARQPRLGEITKTPDGRCFVTTLSGGNGGPRWGYRQVPCPPGAI